MKPAKQGCFKINWIKHYIKKKKKNLCVFPGLLLCWKVKMQRLKDRVAVFKYL